MKSFFFKFNVLWLGSLFLTILLISGIQQSARFSPSDSLIWSTKYLDGIMVGVVMMGLLLVSLLSWCYALWKSWQLTRSDRVISSLRFAIVGYLLAAPLFLMLTGAYWLAAMRIVTDRLIHFI
ncbi:hypothetical protein OA011_00080 [bacterium]|nr:hypothetical protein [bacterium]